MNKITLKNTGIIALILFASFSRIIPHMPNFTPIGAMALFGGAYLKNKSHAFIIPVLSLWFSDIIINNFIYSYYTDFIFFYPGFLWQYLSFIIIAFIGHFILKKINYKNVFFSTIISSLIFFLITNFGVWFSGYMYPMNIDGLIMCYIAALPFYKGTILGFVFYSSFLFGAFESFKRIKLNVK